MAIRTTSDAVIDVLTPGGDYDTNRNVDLTRFIKQGSLLTDRVKQCADSRGFTLTADELLEIETLLAAHFYQQSDKGYQQKSNLRASGSFQGQTKMYLESTYYGQSAVMLDASGCLSQIAQGQRQRAGGFWLGVTEPESQTYEERN